MRLLELSTLNFHLRNPRFDESLCRLVNPNYLWECSPFQLGHFISNLPTTRALYWFRTRLMNTDNCSLKKEEVLAIVNNFKLLEELSVIWKTT